ncbi:histone H4 transcription factor [Lutzomyia longipalpis]|uniref:histone H4 transcription factor n=1 Tax=Lutzomyia longipalpis TaxID=7200 RepID=UPI00248372E7|nr:histone H4 transcription factor [Lutzomyia longipalpis]
MPRKGEKGETEKKLEKKKKDKKEKDAGKLKKKKTIRSTKRKSVKQTKEVPSRPKKPQLNTDPTPENIKCQEWLREQKRQRFRYPKIDLNAESESDWEDEEEESDMNLANLPRDGKKTLVNVLYNCEWSKCTALFEDAAMYKDHVELHLMSVGENKKSNEFRCLWDLCKFTTEDRSAWTRHVRYHTYHSKLMTVGDSLRSQMNFPRCMHDSEQRNMIPDTPYDFLCEWDECCWKTNSILDHFAHVNTHGELEVEFARWDKQSEKVFKCRWIGCEKTFGKRESLMKHIRSHTNEKTVACDNCGAMFIHNSSYFDHCKRQLIHNTMEYVCPLCHRLFATQRLLKNHLRLHVNCHKCHLCDMTCPSMAHLTIHIRHRHMEERPFKCPLCPFKSVLQQDLETHSIIHGPRKVFECSQYDCNFTSCSPKSLKRHESLKHMGPHAKIYLCDCCGRKYLRGDSISMHLKKAHGYKVPPGSSRFFYREGDDGFYHVQTMRIESLEVTKQIMATKKTAKNRRGTTKYALSDPVIADDGVVKLNVKELPKDNNDMDEEDEEEDDDTEKADQEQNEMQSDVEPKQGLSMPLTEDIEEESPPKKNITDFTMMKRYLKSIEENKTA